MASISDLNAAAAAIENDFEGYCRKKGAKVPPVSVFPELFDNDAQVKMVGDCASDEKLLSGYSANLRKRISYVSSGEGEEYAVDLVFPAARAKDLADALNNPGATLKKEFNTVVFTGTMTANRADVEKAASDAGFKVDKKVSKSVDFVIAGDNPGSKADKAHELGIPVLTEAQWARKMKKLSPK